MHQLFLLLKTHIFTSNKDNYNVIIDFFVI